MTKPNYTPLRHKMLSEITRGGGIVLDCVNVKRAIWKPRSVVAMGKQFNLSAAESRAVNDLLFDYAHTPNWQGDMDVLRVVELTDAGRTLLAEWDAKHTAVEQSR